MTLLARDEIDVVDSWLAFHLNAGVDVVIATDNRSQDGTTEVLEEYARSGQVHLIREPGEDLRQDEWVTRMARLAATEYGADWVINSDADEFWWPRGASLAEVLAAVPPRYGTVGAFLRVFCPRPGDGRVRRADDRPLLGARADQRPGVALQADPQDHPPRTSRDPAHARQPRARATARSRRFAAGSRSSASTSRCARSRSASTRPSSRAPRSRSTSPAPPTAYHADMYARCATGGSPSTTRRSSSPTTSSSRVVAEGRLVVDTRLRDALRQLATGRASAALPAPDPRRGRRVRGRGGRARRGRRRPAPAAAGRARAPAADGRAAAAPARLPEADAHRAARSRA